MITHGYTTLAKLRPRLGIDDPADTTDDADLERAIEAASRYIDRQTGQWFWRVGGQNPETPRDFEYKGAELYTPPMISVLRINHDAGADQTFSAILAPGTDYTVERDEWAQDGEPFTLVRFHRFFGARSWTLPQRTVRITADWGWPAVPADIEEACLLIAAHDFALRNVPLGQAGEGTPVGQMYQAKKLIAPFRRGGGYA